MEFWAMEQQRTSSSTSILSAIYTRNASDIKLMDIRHTDQFTLGHLKFSVNIPANTIKDRWYELPDKHIPFYLILPTLPDENFLDRDWKTFLVERRWNIVEALTLSPDMVEEATAMGVWVDSIAHPKQPLRTLFHPCDLLQDHLDMLEKVLCSSLAQEISEPTFRCLDVGCGSGRDAIWLASKSKLDPLQFPVLQQCSLNVKWQVVGLDNWKAALSRVTQFAHRFGVSPQVQLCYGKVNEAGEVLTDLGDPSFVKENGFDMVLCIRFLERSFLKNIPNILRPGGLIVYSTFVMEEAEFPDIPLKNGISDGLYIYPYNHPSSPDRILEFNELEQCFGPEQGFRILVSKKTKTTDGRPLHNFISQRIR